MAPNAVEMQQEANNFLMKVDSNLRELAKKLPRAKEAAEKSREEGLVAWHDLKNVLDCLQQQRTSIRQRSSQKGLSNTFQGKLSAARTRIEAEVRKTRDLEKRFESEAPQPQQQQQPQPQLQEHATRQEGKVDSTTSSPRLASDEGSAPSDAEIQDVPPPPEVKIFAEQMLDVATEGDIAAEFVCKICQIVLVGCKPKLSRCSHLFCGDCIAQWCAVQPCSQSWAGRAKGAGSVPCPVCKEPLRGEDDLHEVCPGGKGGSGFLWQMLSATRVMCANNPLCNPEGKCDWQGDYGSYQAHVRCCKNTPLRMEDVALPEAQAAEVPELEEEQQEEVAETAANTDASAAPGSEDEPADSMVEKNTPRASAQSEPDDATTTDPAEPPSDQDSEDETTAAEGREYREEFSISSPIAQLVELKASETQLRPMELPLTSQVELASDLPPNAFPAQDSSAMKKEKKATPKADKPKVGKTAQDARAKHELEATMRAAQVTQMMQMRMYQAQAMQVQAMQYQAAYAQQARLAYAMQYQAACAAASGRC
mmetsp:Transcript_67853/g.172258  ORF Transcript_67853/g.172258 Transcript_67853/m.172258 type:complete len:537 (+) Transcript_67853:122-1732(+)